MARAAHLKVYRTPIGFHDAYVAAPSQKAALAAWGSVHNLFSTGEAELVTDPNLTEAPLAKPGEIVRRVRGTAAEHIAALPSEPEEQLELRRKQPSAPADRIPAQKPGSTVRAAAKPKPAPRPPKPDKAPVEVARAAITAALKQQRLERQGIAQREQELRRERQALEAMHKASAAALRQAIKAAEAAYAEALAAWRKTDSASPRR